MSNIIAIAAGAAVGSMFGGSLGAAAGAAVASTVVGEAAGRIIGAAARKGASAAEKSLSGLDCVCTRKPRRRSRRR